MAKACDMVVKVASIKGTCANGHKVGDEWVMRDRTPDGMCMDAFTVLLPALRAMRYGAVFPWASDPDVIIVACPDPVNQVFFEVKRLRK